MACLFVRSGWAGHDGALRSGLIAALPRLTGCSRHKQVDGGDRQSLLAGPRSRVSASDMPPTITQGPHHALLTAKRRPRPQVKILCFHLSEHRETVHNTAVTRERAYLTLPCDYMSRQGELSRAPLSVLIDRGRRSAWANHVRGVQWRGTSALHPPDWLPPLRQTLTLLGRCYSTVTHSLRSRFRARAGSVPGAGATVLDPRAISWSRTGSWTVDRGLRPSVCILVLVRGVWTLLDLRIFTQRLSTLNSSG
jgi:hypothetical protein